MLDKLNKIAYELYSEFGFNTCTEEQPELILQEFVERGYYLVSMNNQFSSQLVGRGGTYGIEKYLGQKW